MITSFWAYKVMQDLYHRQPPGRIENNDPPRGSVIYTIGILEPRIGGFYFLDLPGGLGIA